MPTEILMPALSPTMEEGKLAKWLVAEGQSVKPGDVIAEIETDKATMEVEAVDEGKVSKLLVPEGTEGVRVNTPIALLDGEAAASPSPRKPSATPAEARAAEGLRAEGRGEGQPQAPTSAAEGVRPLAQTAAAKAEPMEARGLTPADAVTQTMREALRDAMAEEMRRDPDVFLMGEEVAQYQGAY